MYALLLITACIAQLIDPRSLIDSTEYANSIKYWFQLDTLKLNPQFGRWMYVTRRTPGFPFLLMIFGNQGVLIFQFLAGMLSPFFVFKSIQKLNINANLTLFWALWLLAPLQFFYTAFPMPEIITQCLISIWLWTVLTKRTVIAGVLLLLLILMKPVFMVFLVPICIGLFVKGLNYYTLWPSNWKVSVLIGKMFSISMLVIPVLGILGTAAANYSRWGIFHISSVSTTNFYEYNRYQILTKMNGSYFADSAYLEESKTLDSLSDFSREKGDVLQNLSTETLKRHIKTYLYLHLKGMVQIFVDPGRYDAMVFFKWTPTSGFLGVKSSHQQASSRPMKEWIYIAFFLVVNTIRTLLFGYSLWYALMKNKKLQTAGVFVALNVLMYSLAIGSVGTARYLIPVYPLLVFIIASMIPLKFENESITFER